MIIDAHTHIGTVQNFDMPKEALISSMEKYGIDISITSNCEAVEYDGNHKLLPYFMQTSQENAYQKSIDFARKYPGKIAVMPWVKPHTEGITNELISMIKRNLDVTVGIKVHPFHSFLNFNSPQVEEYIKTAEDVIEGKYGNYPERKTKLEQKGYNYELTQKIVNDLLRG